MALKIIYNHNLLPEGVYRPSYPLEHICAFSYVNSQNEQQIWTLERNRTTKILAAVSQNTNTPAVIVLDYQMYNFDKYKINIIEYSDNILWVGYQHTFYIVDMVSMTAHKYTSVIDTQCIKPIGREYWTGPIDENFTVPVFTWDLLTRLEPDMVPVLNVAATDNTKIYPVTIPGTAVKFVAITGMRLLFLDCDWKTYTALNVDSFFPNYVQLTHPDSGADNELQTIITVNDNCLLCYEWFDVIDNKWGDIAGCESKLCWDFTTGQAVPFANKELNHFVTNVFPFRDFDGVVKLCSHEYYPAGSWKRIYEPDYQFQNQNAPFTMDVTDMLPEPPASNTTLGKRKAEIQITPDV